ncbi:MAG: TerD family protein, partial [Pseudobdellovibrionaceae bacterium]
MKVERGESIAGVTNLIFSPEVTTWLEEGSNYILFLEVEGKCVFKNPIRWGGIAPNKALLGSRMPASSLDLSEQNQLVVISTNEAFNGQSHEDEAAWIIAKNLDSKTGYKEYLDRFPSGRFSEFAGVAFRQFMPPNVIVRVTSNIAESRLNCLLDTSVFLLSSDRRVSGDRDFVDLLASEADSGQILSKTPCGSVCHLGREDSSENGYAIESISIEFSSLPSSIKSLAITVSIYTPSAVDVGLESVDSGTVEILQAGSKVSIYEIPMKKELYGVKGSFLVEFIRRGDDWKLLERNEVFTNGLQEICK